jgi:hypothetical protein
MSTSALLVMVAATPMPTAPTLRVRACVLVGRDGVAMAPLARM